MDGFWKNFFLTSISFYKKLLYNVSLNAHRLWDKFVITLNTFFFLKNTPTHIDFVSCKALITQNILFLGDVIKVVWLVWEREFGKALGDIIFGFFVYRITCFGQVSTIEYNSIVCNIN